MRYDGLFVPISDAQPCGPDLDEIGDDDFLTYTLSVDDRFPVRYYDLDSGAPFDRAGIDLRAEIATVSTLLERTRDLRLLGIEARFQALSGQISGFCDCVLAIAGLLERFWAEVHPRPYGTDHTLRQNTVSTLANRVSVILPLQNAPILRDRRHGPITYRHQMVVNGDAAPLPAARLVSAADIADAFANLENIAAAAECHADIGAAIEALQAIEAIFVEKAGFDYAPDVGDLRETLEKILGLIEAQVPTLAPTNADAGDSRRESDQPAAVSQDSAAPARRPDAPRPIGIASHAAARAALATAERYFSRHETSSPALILVSQARQLVGKPLVATLQALVPDLAERAVIRIDADNGFQLDMTRMRDVTDGFAADGDGIVVAELERFDFTAASRSEAIALLLGVEAFLGHAEPSSPIPLLLEKARGFLEQDFRSILKSLIVR